MTEHTKPLWMERWFQLLLGSLVLLAVGSLVVPWLLGLVYALRSVLLPLVIALGLAYIFNPIVTWMNRRLRLPRWAGTGVVFIGAIWAVMILGLLILPPLISQSADLIEKAKTYPEKITTLVQEQSAKHSNTDAVPAESGVASTDTMGDAGTVTEVPTTETADAINPATDMTGTGPEEITATEEDLLDQLRVIIDDALGPERAAGLLATAADWLSTLDWGKVAQFVLSSLDVGVGVVGSALSLTSYLVLSAVIAGFCFFFFSWKLDKLIGWFVPFIPAQHKTEVLGVVVQMDKSVASFIRGRLVQASVMACVLSIGWWLAGVPSWLLLGVLSGLLNLVPFAAVVGFLAALVLVLVDTVAGGSFTIWVVVWPTVVYVLAQGLDGWVVEPIVQGKATDLDPVSVLLAVMIGGALAGLLGMLIAIPSAACIKILSREVILPRLRKLAAGESTADVT
jgi:predicted PurR-regulated permease PerM